MPEKSSASSVLLDPVNLHCFDVSISWKKQTSGKILYHNKEVRDVQKEINEYRSKVGMVFSLLIYLTI